MADRVPDSTASIRRGLNQHGCERIVLPSLIRVQSTKLIDISFVAYTDGLCPLCMVYQMAKEFATRRYQLTINNPKEHGFDHDTIKAILAKGAKLLYWCMSDEEGKEETYHTHLYLVFCNAVMFKTLKNKFPTAHIEVPQWGTNSENYAYIARVMSGTAAGIAEAYTKNARGQTIIFAPSIEEGKNVTALLNSQHGASTAAFIDGTTQNRGHFLEAYRLGLIKVLVCYAVLTEGVDLPMTETVVLARPIARTNVGLYAQMVGRGLRLYPGKASCKVIDCVGVSNMPICTAATLIGKDVPAPKPEKEPTEKLPEEQDPIKVLEGNEIPDSWIKNQKEVNVMALGEGYTTHDVAWLDVKGGGRILPLPNVVYRISKPLPNGMVYLRKNKKCSRCAVPLQFVLDYVYQDLKQNHPQQQHIWDKKQRYKWDRQPITSEQISLIHKLAPDYKIDTKKMTRGDASRVIQLLAYAPKEQDAQEQAQEVQDDAT